jgi:hypothetical protein
LSRSRDQEVNQSKTLLGTVLLFLVLNLSRLVLFNMEIRRIQGFSLCKVTAPYAESRASLCAKGVPDPPQTGFHSLQASIKIGHIQGFSLCKMTARSAAYRDSLSAR